MGIKEKITSTRTAIETIRINWNEISAGFDADKALRAAIEEEAKAAGIPLKQFKLKRDAADLLGAGKILEGRGLQEWTAFDAMGIAHQIRDEEFGRETATGGFGFTNNRKAFDYLLREGLVVQRRRAIGTTYRVVPQETTVR